MTEPGGTSSWTLVLGAQPHLAAADGRMHALEGIDALLLAWLALEGPTPRARLLGLLWPDEAAITTLRNRLRQRLFALKRRLGDEAVTGAETLSLGPALAWPGFDFTAEDAALLGAEAAPGSPELAHWLATQRERLLATRREQLAGEAARLEREGRLAEALAVAQRRVRLEPLQEHAHRHLMRLHYLRGDRAAAIQAFEQCERLLKDELGVRPGAETLTLLAQVESASMPVAPVARPVTASLLRPPRLVGRAREWQQLSAAWAQRLPVVLSGEGGLGKSRLLADLATAQPQPVLHITARPGDADMPLTLLSRVLRALVPVRERRLPAGTLAELARLLPELGEAPPATTDTGLRQHNAVRAAIATAAAEGLFALVLDDLHLADTASLELLHTLLAEPGLVWAAAWRPGPPAPALQAFLGALLGAGQALPLVLQPLGVDDIAEFCDSLALPGLEGRRWAQPLHQRTGGNPQYMLEIIKAWWLMPATPGDGPPGAALAAAPTAHALPTPVSLPGLVCQRIEALSPAAVDLARCAAVAGEDFSPELAATVLRLRPVDLANPWAELEAARVFAGERFAHDLIAEAARASVPHPVARALHAEVAAALQQGGLPQPAEPARLAHHWAEAGRWRPAAEAFEATAARCAERGQRPEEAQAWQHAAQAWGRSGEPERQFQALARRAEQRCHYANAVLAREALDEAEAQARTPAQQRRMAALRMDYAQHISDFDTTLRIGPAAVENAWADAGPEAAFHPALLLAGALAKQYRAGEAITLLERLRDWVDSPEARDDHRRLYWNTMAIALDFAHRFGEARQAWRTTQHYARITRSDLLGQAINNEAFTLNKMGRMDEAAARCREGLRLSLAQGEAQEARADYQRMALGHHLRSGGHYAEALGLLTHAQAALRGHGFHADAAVTAHLLAVLWVHLGQPDRAHRLLDDDPAAPPLPPRLQPMRQAHRVMTAQALGLRDAALEREALALADACEADSSDNLVPRIGGLLVGPALPPARAEALAVQLAAWFAARQRMGHALAAHIRAGAAALAQGEPGRAWPHVQAAAELAREHQPDIVYPAEQPWVAAQVLQALGRHDERQRLLAAARAWVLGRAEALEPALRPAFLERQQVNADLLRWSAG